MNNINTNNVFQDNTKGHDSNISLNESGFNLL